MVDLSQDPVFALSGLWAAARTGRGLITVWQERREEWAFR